MAGHFFYFIGLWIFLLNLILLTNTIKYLKIKEWAVKFKKVSGRFPMRIDFKPNEFEFFLFTNTAIILTFFWLFLGLISSNWLVALVLMSFNITFASISRMFEFNFISTSTEFLKNFVTTILIGFLVFNHFHLHLDITQILFGK